MKEDNTKVTFAGNPLTLIGEPIKVGDKAPDFTLLNGGLEPIKLSDYDGKVRVLAIYPSIDTGVCAAQNRRFNVEANKLKDVVVLSISCDLPFAQARFCAAEGLDKIIPLSDHKETEFGIKYGFLLKELRLLSRGTVVINKDGVVTFVEFVPEVTNEPNYETALEAIKAL